MNVLDAIAQRRSIRSYKDEQITREQLDTLLQAGLYAPSAVNSQPWHFTAVQDQSLIDRINAATQKQLLKTCAPEMRERFASPAFHVFHHAPTVIFISCPPLSERRYAQTDVGIAIENMALAACGLGLGSVILGMPGMPLPRPKATNSAACSISRMGMTSAWRCPWACRRQARTRIPSGPTKSATCCDL